MAMLDELGSAIGSVAEKVGSAAVRVGGGWRGGSGLVVGQGAVLTNAHNVRSDELTVTFADGRQATGTLAGVDVDGDLAVIAVDTGSTTPLEWADRRGKHRHPGLRRDAQRQRAACHVRLRLERRACVPRTARAAHHRQPRAHRSPRSRLVRQRPRGRQRQARWDQHEPHGRRLLPGTPRRRVA